MFVLNLIKNILFLIFLIFLNVFLMYLSLYVITLTSVQFIMQINKCQCPSEKRCSQDFLLFKFFLFLSTMGTLKSTLLVCDVVTLEKWIMGKDSHDKLELLLINTCFDRCLL